MKETILERYDNLRQELYRNYDKVYIVDNYDFFKSNAYTIFYLNKNESFNDFKKLWESVVYEVKELDDYYYEDVLNMFYEKAKDTFDYVELSSLDIYTEKEYQLEI